MASLVIGFMLLSPTAILPEINAQTIGNVNSLSIPTHAIATQNFISQQLKIHPGWVGMMRWDSNSTSIDYLGPADSNPFKIKATPLTEMSVSVPQNVEIAPKGDRAGSTTEYKEVSDFTNVQSSTGSVDIFQVLNAIDDSKKHWIQAGLIWDVAHIFGTTTNWKFLLDSFTQSGSSCNHDGSYPLLATLTVSAGDSMEEYIYADQSTVGLYGVGITDVTKNNGYLTSISYSGETNKVINLDQTSCFPSGPQVEEHDKMNMSNTSTYSPITFTEGYYDTSTSTKTTSVTGWESSIGCGATVSTSNSPATATFTHTATTC